MPKLDDVTYVYDDVTYVPNPIGVLSNLALYGRRHGGKVCRILAEHGAVDALQVMPKLNPKLDA
jgi:hypothetical protein